MRSLLGRPRARIQDAANLAGAPDDAVVTVAIIPMHGWRIIESPVESQAVRLRVLLSRRFEGKPILENDQIDVSRELQRRGHGSSLLGRQVEHAMRLGVAEIQGFATRDDQMGDIGYRVWPLPGFDGTLPETILRKLPTRLAGARRIHDLLRTKHEQQWWLDNGESSNVAFDLRSQSQSPNRRSFRATRSARKRPFCWPWPCCGSPRRSTSCGNSSQPDPRPSHFQLCRH
jgi:hypothetical protein